MAVRAVSWFCACLAALNSLSSQQLQEDGVRLSKFWPASQQPLTSIQLQKQEDECVKGWGGNSFCSNSSKDTVLQKKGFLEDKPPLNVHSMPVEALNHPGICKQLASPGNTFLNLSLWWWQCDHLKLLSLCYSIAHQLWGNLSLSFAQTHCRLQSPQITQFYN